VHVDTKK